MPPDKKPTDVPKPVEPLDELAKLLESDDPENFKRIAELFCNNEFECNRQNKG